MELYVEQPLKAFVSWAIVFGLCYWVALRQKNAGRYRMGQQRVLLLLELVPWSLAVLVAVVVMALVPAQPVELENTVRLVQGINSLTPSFDGVLQKVSGFGALVGVALVKYASLVLPPHYFVSRFYRL
ncbi:hypothetical protein [Aliagarivorans taiwanensis]|uniref:hypothetical protein n=1 Tax=Aliagarivorans taiwanensis TaxID=561966 RepID=UPI00047BDEFB|nr:hypothetical protein [Aliagarivorans taiwanensis]